jgi:hypothetical protein
MTKVGQLLSQSDVPLPLPPKDGCVSDVMQLTISH